MSNNNMKLKVILIFPTLFILFSKTIYCNYHISVIQPTITNNDGRITVSLGDASPYDILISPTIPIGNFSGFYGKFAQFRNLAEGTYVITILDKIDCMYQETVELVKMTCPLTINLVDLQHNSHDQLTNHDGRIAIEIGPDLDVNDYNVYWEDGQGNNILQDQLSLDFKPTGVYTVFVEHKITQDCNAQRAFEISSCRTTSYNISEDCDFSPCAEVITINIGPSTEFEILEIIAPATFSSVDGEILYSLSSVGGDAFINWLDLNEEAERTGSSIRNVQEGTYCYEIENGCGNIQSDCIEVISCARNINLTGEMLNVVSPQCESMEYSVRFGIEYTNANFNIDFVEVTLSKGEDVQMFTLQNKAYIDLMGLSLGGTYHIKFEDNCGRLYEQDFSVVDEVSNYTSPCNSFEKGTCGFYITNGSISFSTECKTGDCSNYTGDFPFGFPNFGFDNAEIHLDTDFSDWNYCEVEIMWPNASVTTVTRNNDGTYNQSGPSSANVGAGRYEISVSINGGECFQTFTSDFGEYVIIGQRRTNNVVFGTWAVNSTMDRELIPQNPSSSNEVCGELEYKTVYVFVPNDPLSSNPCQDGGFWYEWDVINGRQINSGGIILPNGFSSPEFINVDFDNFPYCKESGQIHACVFLNESIAGIPNLPGEDVFMYFCNDPEQTIEPSCEPLVEVETPSGLCSYSFFCQDGSIATLGGIPIEPVFRGTVCWVEVGIDDCSCGYINTIGDEVKYCSTACELVETIQSNILLTGENQTLCKDLFPSCPPESFLDM